MNGRISTLAIIVVTALATGMCPATSSGKNTSNFNTSGNTRTVCSDWATIPLGEYEMQNNVWGKRNIRNYSQCIFGKYDFGSAQPVNIGWTWDWPALFVGVKAYPSILYGRKPWNSYSTSPYLPRSIEQLKHLSVSFKIKTKAKGAVNLLLESWITKSSTPSPKDRVGELAIHLYQNKWPGQAGAYIKPVVIDGIAFDFYVDKHINVPGDTHHWVYYGFVHKGGPLLQAKLDIVKFTDFLVRQGYVNRQHYIATVELGNEIDHGEGETLIENFSVEVGY